MRRVKVNDSISADVAQPSRVSGKLTGMTSAVFGYIGGDPNDQTNLVELIDEHIATKPTKGLANEIIERKHADELLNIRKVDKEAGKGLSTNDYTTEDKTKLAGIESGAEVNLVDDVQVDNVSVVQDKIAKLSSDVFGKVNDVKVNGGSVVQNKIAEVTVPTKTSEISNDSGFITKSVNDLTNYSTTTDMNTAIANHHDSTKQNVIDGSHKLSADYINDGSTNKVVTQSEKDTWNNKEPGDATILKQADVVNDTSTESTIYPLSANMGRELQAQIDNLKGRGRFLSVWNSTTGLPTTTPTTLPYTYKTGDYYVVGYVGSTNYKPVGETFTGAASTTQETNEVGINDTYYYDGSAWSLFHTVQPEVSFSSLAGSPYDNTNLSNVLNSKQDELTAGANITIDSEGVISAANPTEYTTKLQEDLYTYTNIGKITGASQTNPIKVADAGDPLKDVFNAILGTEVDIQPTISSNTSISKSETGTGTISAYEMGASVAQKNATYTFTVLNTETAQYGIKTLNHDTHQPKIVKNTQFIYPIKTNQVTVNNVVYNYNIRVELNSSYHNIVTATTGSIVITSGNYIYCNLDSSNNKLVLNATLPSTTYTSSEQTRCTGLKAFVEFNSATYSGETITGFYTYLGNISTDASVIARKNRAEIETTATSGCKVPKGIYYTYYKVTNSDSHVSTGWISTTSTAIEDIVIVADPGQYIWIASTQNKTYIYEWNDVSGKYNTDPTVTTKASNQAIHLDTGIDGSYYTYRTAPRSGATNKKFKIA